MLAGRTPGETDQQIEERLKEQIRTQHLHQLLGASAIEAETYRQRLPQMLATRRPEETEQEIEERLSKEVRGEPAGTAGLAWVARKSRSRSMPGSFWPHRTDGDRNARFDKLCHFMLSERNIYRRHGVERLIHYVCSLEPRLRSC